MKTQNNKTTKTDWLEALAVADEAEAAWLKTAKAATIAKNVAADARSKATLAKNAYYRSSEGQAELKKLQS